MGGAAGLFAPPVVGDGVELGTGEGAAARKSPDFRLDRLMSRRGGEAPEMPAAEP